MYRVILKLEFGVYIMSIIVTTILEIIIVIVIVYYYYYYFIIIIITTTLLLLLLLLLLLYYYYYYYCYYFIIIIIMIVIIIIIIYNFVWHLEYYLLFCFSYSHDSHSDTSSSVSQTSYDPLRPQFKHMDGEIPDSTSTSTDSSGAITLVSAKPSAAAKGKV